jgi:predicted MPP superfamily phosphohydrolase
MQVVREINKLEKDLVVISGDIITGSVNNFWKRWMPKIKGDYLAMVVDVLGNLDGGDKIAVLGNHDQWDDKMTELRLVSELERIGIRVLRNSSRKLARGQSSLYVAGTDDYWFSCDLEKALRRVPQNEFKILLCHSPGVREGIKNKTKIDLTLCGHTHGGQVAIPFISQHFIPIKDPFRYMAGLIKEPYGYTYVNRGIGTLVFPLIDLLRAEIRSGPLINVDESPLQVLNEAGRSNTSKSYMWVYRGGQPDRPVLLYQYHRTRSGKTALEFLDKYHGYIMTPDLFW